MRALITYDSETDLRNPRDTATFHVRLTILRKRWHFKSLKLVHHRDAWEQQALLFPYIKSLKMSVVNDVLGDGDNSWRDRAVCDIDFAELMNDTGW